MRTISDVVRQLQEEDDGDFVYRGQIHTYEEIIPSALRGATIGLDGPANYLSRNRLVSGLTRRSGEQQRFREFLIEKHGSGLGSIFAQQYLVNSTVVDVSSSPTIGAFFATRRWPTYEHVQEGVGRVYRWRRTHPHRTPQETLRDSAVGYAVKMDDPDRVKMPTIPRLVAHDSHAGRAVREGADGWVVFPSTIFTFEEILDAVQHGMQSSSGWVGALRGLDASRWFAQQGGFLRPEIRFPAIIRDAADEGLAMPETAHPADSSLDKQVTISLPEWVIDAAHIGPPEAFEFTHTAETIDIDPRTLWPSAVNDPLFEYCCAMVWAQQASRAYFDDALVETPWDQEAGLLDRGVYPFDTRGSHDQAAWDILETYREEDHSDFQLLLDQIRREPRMRSLIPEGDTSS